MTARKTLLQLLPRRSSLTFARAPRYPVLVRPLVTCGIERSPASTSSQNSFCRVQPTSSYCTGSTETWAQSGIKFTCEDDGKNVKVIFDDGYSTRFNATWLRYHCHCDQCKQAHSGQRLIDPTSVPNNLTVKHAELNGDKSLVIEFNEHNHKAIIPVDFLRENDYSPAARAERSRLRDPLYLTGADKLPTVDFNDMNTNEGLLSWLVAVNDYGAAVIKNAPTREDFLIGELLDVERKGFKIHPTIGPVMPTIYGNSFVVEGTDKPVNVAYTDVHLDLHMDLIYYESAPGIQLLHCVRFDDVVQGGESVLLDSFLVAEQMRERFPAQFDALRRIPASFQKVHYERDSPVSMKYQKPVMVCNPEGKLTAVNWAPAFESPLSIAEEDIPAFYEAYKTYATLLNESPHLIKFRLVPGDVMTFNNRRVLHGRSSFVLNGGQRKLIGCYMNIDEFKSQVEVCAQLCGKPRIAKRVGNHDFF